MNFPVYRKYKNDKSFFKISSFREFEELKIWGSKYSIHSIKADILPDRNFIHDMLNNINQYWEEIEAPEYQEKLNICIQTKTKI